MAASLYYSLLLGMVHFFLEGWEVIELFQRELSVELLHGIPGMSLVKLRGGLSFVFADRCHYAG